MLSPADTGSWTLLQTCSKISLDKFIACFCDREFSVLIIKGEPPPDVLLSNWEAVYMEFNDLMQDESYSLITDAVNRINRINAKIKFVAATVAYLQHEYNDGAVAMLATLGISITLNPDNQEQYFKGLQRIVTRTKKWMIDLEDAHIELSKMQEKQVNTGTNYDFFDDALNSLSKHHGYAIRPIDITASRFCKMYNQLKLSNQVKQLRNGN